MTIERITDVDLLIRFRLDYFANDSQMPDEKMDILKANLRSYFTKHVALDDFICLAVKDEVEFVSVGFMVVNEMPPNGFAPEGRTGTLINVVTYPQHQKKGYGKFLVESFVELATKLKLSFIDLYSTDAGESMYGKVGFKPIPYKAMRLKL